MSPQSEALIVIAGDEWMTTDLEAMASALAPLTGIAACTGAARSGAASIATVAPRTAPALSDKGEKRAYREGDNTKGSIVARRALTGFRGDGAMLRSRRHPDRRIAESSAGAESLSPSSSGASETVGASSPQSFIAS